MIDDMMNCSLETMSGMMLAMGLFGLLVTIILILATVTLVKYLFFNNRSEKHEESSDVKHGL